MASDQRQPPSISTRDIHEYLNRQSKMCDSRIEDAYMRLSNRYGERRPSSSTAAGQLERRTLSSSSMRLPSQKTVATDHIVPPSSTQERRPNDSMAAGRPRGILKKTQSPVANSIVGSKGSRESPHQWFQRIMHKKKLSPLDLCEVFSYGDARKHPLVPLSHVCEVLFDLDPESANGADPVTDEMEDFLYQFAKDQGGEIKVNIREALRALDIWQSRVVSASSQADPSKSASDPESKAIILESKNRKLMGVISSLQDANLRLSRQLDSSKLALSPKSTDESAPRAWSPRNRSATKPSSVEVSPVKSKATSPIKATAFLASSGEATTSKLQVVNLHEQELVEIASKLQFSGVKQLEELLKEGDDESTGFVNLKQLCYLLADQFQLSISEVRLIEVCMGMNFNSSAQLDYREFVDVLLDILIYALPDIRESAKRKSLISLDKYLQSGFPPGREGARQLLDTLCSKYDLNGDQCISARELVRVFHKDLVKHHAFELPFPLEEHETIQLAHPFLQRNEKDKAAEGFLSYPEFLDAISGPFPQDFNPGMNGAKHFKRALRWEFWHRIYMTLCGGDTLIEEKVLTQLTKILTKVDPKLTYTLSTRHFKRIFEQHISSDDLEVMMTVLAVPEDESVESDGNPTCLLLRYDVLLKLIFGSPELNDEHFLDSYVRRHLQRERERLQSYASELMATKGAAHKLTIEDFYDAFVDQADAYPLSLSALLFLFSSVSSCHDGTVAIKALKDFLSRRCWRTHERVHASADSSADVDSSSSTTDFSSIKKLLAECCAAYDLQRVVDDLSRNTNGWISRSNLLKELTKMLRGLGVEGVQQNELTQFIQSITNSNECVTKHSTKPPTRDALDCDALFDILFDWDTLIHDLRLPHSLAEIKKVFERFDWDRMGSIRCEDWNKAYRLICHDHQGLAGWKVRVLQRRFPDDSRERDSSIDYARLLVYLLTHQQRQERECLQDRVLEHFQQMFATKKHGSMPTAEMEKLFRSLDTDNKGYFNSSDLKAYLTKEFLRNGKPNGAENRDTELLKSSDALAAMMHFLAGDNMDSPHQHTPSRNSESPTVVTLERFLEIANSFSTPKSTFSSLSKSRSLPTRDTARIAPANMRAHDVSSNGRDCGTISSLRVLEITLLEMISEFVDPKGNILPAKAFRYLSLGPTSSATDTTRKYRPSSPLRCSTSSSPTNRGAGLSVTTRNQRRILEASTLDPLTPTKLKQLLQVYHNVDVSTHLVSQFFLHIGSPSKYFLDLVHFAQWAAPLSIELQVKVRGVVRQMIVKGKGGGGKVDLDRFLAQLQRRLQDSPHYMASSENPPVPFVSMPLLLSKLHQLNIPLHKQELMALLRHFGMEENLEAVDYVLLLQRLSELNSSMSTC